MSINCFGIVFYGSKKIDKNQTKLGILTLDNNIAKDYIPNFVVGFIKEVYPMLNIEEPKGRKSLPIDSMLKLFVYAKIGHVESAKYIADIEKAS